MTQNGINNEFYSRQIVMPELGQEGQRKLAKSKVALIGLGGLGSISSLYLTLAGVGYLRLVDQDTVELHNLHRQALYDRKDLRYPKVEVAAKRLQEKNPDVRFDVVPENVTRSNVDEFVKDMDCIVDGLDNMSTRYVVNEACFRRGIPYVFGGAIGLEGNVTVFHPPETPCLECVFPGIDDDYVPTCSSRGVIGATPGVIAAIQALETVKILTGIEGTLKNRLLVCDFHRMDFVTIDLIKAPDCKICQTKAEIPEKALEHLTWMCGRNTVNVNPPKPLVINLTEAKEKIGKNYKILVSSPIILVFEYKNGVEVSLFRQGRTLIKNIESEEQALSIYHEVIDRILPTS
jgi:molybdopterin/thiamine biosynthesis adenylyltransferase